MPEGEPIGWSGKQGDVLPPLRCRIVGWETEIAPPPDDLEALLTPANYIGAAPQMVDAAVATVRKANGLD